MLNAWAEWIVGVELMVDAVAAATVVVVSFVVVATMRSVVVVVIVVGVHVLAGWLLIEGLFA